jgi:hypothetical protein
MRGKFHFSFGHFISSFHTFPRSSDFGRDYVNIACSHTIATTLAPHSKHKHFFDFDLKFLCRRIYIHPAQGISPFSLCFFSSSFRFPLSHLSVSHIFPQPPPATQPLLNYAFPRRPAPEVAQDATPRKRRDERLDLPVSNERARYVLLT